MKILINNATIITQNFHRDIISRGFLLIEDDIITALGRGNYDKRLQKMKDIKVVNASNYIIIPGLINTHVHLGESIYANLIKGKLGLKEYLDFTNNLSKISDKIKLNREIICEYSLLRILRNGTTTICGGRTNKSAEKFGIRNVSGYMLMKSNSLGKYSKNIKKQFFEEYAVINHSLTRPAIFIHSLNTVDKQIIAQIKKIAEIYPNLTIIVHIAETIDSEKQVRKIWKASAVKTLKKSGLLNKKMLIVHGNHISDADLKLIIHSQASIVHCLSSNLRVADATINLKKIHKKGASICIATDGVATSGTFSILSEGRLCLLFHNRFSDAGNHITSQEIFDMITINAARAIGMADIIGSIEIGKKADLCFIKNQFDGNYLGADRLVENIIMNGEFNGISGIMVNGRFLMWNQKITVVNENKTIEKFIRLEKDVWNELISKKILFV